MKADFSTWHIHPVRLLEETQTHDNWLAFRASSLGGRETPLANLSFLFRCSLGGHLPSLYPLLVFSLSPPCPQLPGLSNAAPPTRLHCIFLTAAVELTWKHCQMFSWSGKWRHLCSPEYIRQNKASQEGFLPDSASVIYGFATNYLGHEMRLETPLSASVCLSAALWIFNRGQISAIKEQEQQVKGCLRRLSDVSYLAGHITLLLKQLINSRRHVF